MRYLDGLAVDQLLARTDSSGNTAWYLTDQVGSVRRRSSAPPGRSLDQIIYDTFGNIVTQTNATDAVRFMFAGMEYDSVTGLYYDHARYYDAVIGRFVSQDPMGFAAGDTNLYRYVGNSPTSIADPSGSIVLPVTKLIAPSLFPPRLDIGDLPPIQVPIPPPEVSELHPRRADHVPPADSNSTRPRCYIRYVAALGLGNVMGYCASKLILGFLSSARCGVHRRGSQAPPGNSLGLIIFARNSLRISWKNCILWRDNDGALVGDFG